MSFLGNIFPFIGDSAKEIFSHPLQAAGAALGVPGYDPFFGGLFNNKPGGALLSPTGNFTSSAWQDMYNRNPGDAGALNQFSAINSVADKIAPAMAGYFAAPAMGAAFGGAGPSVTNAASAGGGTSGLLGSGAGASGLTGLMGGPAALGDAGLTGAVSAGGSGLGTMGAADMGSALGSAPTGLFSGLLPGGGMTGTASGALGGGLSGEIAGAAPLGEASMGGLFGGADLNTQQVAQQVQSLMNQRNQQQQQQQQGPGVARPVAFGNPYRPNGMSFPSMPYASFNGIGSAYGSV